MTAETLKPFISLPSATTPKRNIHVFIIIGLLSAIVLVASLSGFVVWKSTSRVNDLEEKVYTLQRVMDNLQRRLGLNYLEEFDDLKEFEKAYTSNDPNTSDETDGDLLVDSYGDVEDYEDADDDLENENENDDGLNLDGSGNYSDDEDDDDDDDEGDRKLYDDLKKFQESRKLRKSRSISSISNGLPIYHGSYTMRKNKTDEFGSDEHIIGKGYSTTMRPKDIMVDPKKQYTEETGRNHHRGKMVHGSPRNHMRRREWNAKHHMLRPLLPLSSEGRHFRNKPQALTMMPSMKAIAVHYYINHTLSGPHSYYDGNHLHHENNVFTYVGLPHNRKFEERFEVFEVNNGILRVLEAGVYYIYAQVYYENSFDQNGYKIYHNHVPFLQCSLTIPLNIMKSNTCYTSGVIHLNVDDTIHIRDIFRDHKFLNGKGSFFGFIKLGSSY